MDPSQESSSRWLSRHNLLCLPLSFALVSIFYSTRDIYGSQTIYQSLSSQKLLVTNNDTLPLTTDIDDFLNTTWPPLRKALCGKGAPNLMLANILFKLARSEVFGAKGAAGNTSEAFRLTREFPRVFKLKKDSSTKAKFFAGEFRNTGLSLFHGVNADGQPFNTVYVRIWKCGNDQIRRMEENLSKHLNGTYRNLPVRQAFKKYLPAVYKKHSKSNLPPMPPPCVYTAVRDPVSHFLSGYNEVEFRQLEEYNNRSYLGIPGKSKRAPYHHAFPYSENSPELRKTRFKAFVEDLLLEEKVFGQHGVYQHFFDMSRVLVSLKNHKVELNGYIPGLSNITSVWPRFMSSTCPNFPALDTIPKMTIDGQHTTSKDPLGLYKAAKEVWAEGGPISRSICILHAFDYACFPELAKNIPLLCKFVYRDHAEDIVRLGTKHHVNHD